MFSTSLQHLFPIVNFDNVTIEDKIPANSPNKKNTVEHEVAPK